MQSSLRENRGADINKFIGVLDVEKKKFKKDKSTKNHSIVGYFISLSGFKETAIEQENEIGNKRVILLKSEKIIEELIRGRILVSKEKAISSIKSFESGLVLLNYVDLLAYDKGWVWVFYYSNSEGQQVTHFALVHAEGKPLIEKLSEEIISKDKLINNIFSDLILINNDTSNETNRDRLLETQSKYFNYLENELGEIQFEGLPTDKEAGSVKVKLETIFVPLHFNLYRKRSRKIQLEIEGIEREGIGEILSKTSRLAILAKPGGGKSTLIKRIAIAYAFPERRKQINDKLPEKKWFPIFLRCRELGEKVTQSITEIIHNIPIRAEIHSCIENFSILVSEALQDGTALLLIDGLDEISEDKSRIAFVNQLRTFIATYPTLNIIVTSREAGFRAVAGSLASYCENYTVSNLLPEEIESLCIKWHKAIIDDSENTIKEAKKLSELILKDSRIRVLAENPLLLTTLLFVKRWAGYLPTKRSILYQEMIKLLLVTWNVEGHEILDIEEAEPQLAYVAYWMTKNGKQTITADELNNCLIAARRQLPEILGYTNINPSEFIKRVESRSSLLIMAGHLSTGSNNLIAVYEFLHLSFQEYLTAKAIVKKFIPQTDIEARVVDIIKPNINNESWKEVIPLAAVLLERDTKELIDYLIAEAKTLATKDKRLRLDELASSLLGSCLANEIQINPDTLDNAIEWYAKNIYSVRDRKNTEIILKNKFGTAFRKKINDCFFEKYDDKYASSLGYILADIFLFNLKNPENRSTIPLEILSVLKRDSKEEKCMAVLGMMSFSFDLIRSKEKNPFDNLVSEEIFDILFNLLKTKDSHYVFSICWCLVWTGEANVFPVRKRLVFVAQLIRLWIKTEEHHLHRVISWALCNLLRPTISKQDIPRIPKLKEKILELYLKPSNEFDKFASVYLGKIIGHEFSIDQIFDLYQELDRAFGFSESYSEFAMSFGVPLKEQSDFGYTKKYPRSA